MLTTHAADRAVAYLFNHLDNLPLWGDILQMAVLELIRKVSGAGVSGCMSALPGTRLRRAAIHRTLNVRRVHAKCA
jgi:hypothetical protein